MRGEFRDYEDRNRFVEARYDRNLGCSLHFHSKIEFSYCLSGMHTAVVNGIKKQLTKDDICFVNSFDTHSLKSEHGDRHYVVSFSKDNMELFTDIFFGMSFSNFLTDKEFNLTLLPLIEELYKNGKELNYVAQSGYINLLLGRLAAHYKLEKRPSFTNEIKDILIYINENYDNVITREILADRMGYSPNYFSTLFKENVGMGFIDYLNMVRCQNVKAMMDKEKFSHLSLTEVIMRNGFDSLATYYRALKKGKAVL